MGLYQIRYLAAGVVLCFGLEGCETNVGRTLVTEDAGATGGGAADANVGGNANSMGGDAGVGADASSVGGSVGVGGDASSVAGTANGGTSNVAGATGWECSMSGGCLCSVAKRASTLADRCPASDCCFLFGDTAPLACACNTPDSGFTCELMRSALNAKLTVSQCPPN
jgi:hypothetical protein